MVPVLESSTADNLGTIENQIWPVIFTNGSTEFILSSYFISYRKILVFHFYLTHFLMFSGGRERVHREQMG